MNTAANYILELATRGRHHFTTEEVAVALGGSIAAVRAALRRLKAKGEIVDPFRGCASRVTPGKVSEPRVGALVSGHRRRPGTSVTMADFAAIEFGKFGRFGRFGPSNIGVGFDSDFWLVHGPRLP